METSNWSASAWAIARFYADIDDASKSKADLAAYFTDDFKDLDRHPLAPDVLSDKEAHLAFFDELKGGSRASAIR
ncbi:MAG: hypothetical protein AAFR47_04395 [Pseudomonadota bacterium]